MWRGSDYAFDCGEGARPSEYTVSFHKLQMGSPQHWSPANIYVTPVTRTDIQAQYAAQCPGLSSDIGYTLTFSEQPAVGYWRMYVTWNDYYGEVHTDTRLIQIVQ